MNKRRVVITGMGALTPIGNSIEEFWKGLTSGKNGINKITRFDTADFATQFAGEIKNLNVEDFIDKKAARRMDRFTHFALITAEEAIKNSGMDLESVDRNRFGVVYGSGIGGMQTYEESHTALMNGGPRRVSPFFIPMMISDIAAGHISIKFGLKGPNYATTSACSTSSHAIADSFILIQRGSADIMVTGGAEASITPISVAGFNAARALSTWNDKFEIASRPFDKDRNGFVMAEGSGTLILEELEHAKNRGAKIYAEVVGVGLSGDAFHITAPAEHGEGASRSMKEALRDAEVQPNEVDYINAHGTSTELNDKNETEAIKTVFGDHAYKLLVSSTKSMTGHLLGAAGAVEAIACTLAINNSIIPPTINLDEPSPGLDLNYCAKVPVEKEINYALSNTFGFGGHNASLLFKKYSE